MTAPGDAPVSEKQIHARRCFLLGITNPDRVAALWAEELVRRAAHFERAKQDRKTRARTVRTARQKPERG